MSAGYDQAVEAHILFCALIERDIPWDMQRLYPWEAFLARFTTDDLRLVVEYIKSLRKQGRPARELTFRSLISGPCALQWFAEDLAEARALARQPRPTAKDRLLASTHRPAPIRDNTVTAAQCLERGKLAEMLRHYRESL